MGSNKNYAYTTTNISETTDIDETNIGFQMAPNTEPRNGHSINIGADDASRVFVGLTDQGAISQAMAVVGAEREAAHETNRALIASVNDSARAVVDANVRFGEFAIAQSHGFSEYALTRAIDASLEGARLAANSAQQTADVASQAQEGISDLAESLAAPPDARLLELGKAALAVAVVALGAWAYVRTRKR